MTNPASPAELISLSMCGRMLFTRACWEGEAGSKNTIGDNSTTFVPASIFKQDFEQPVAQTRGSESFGLESHSSRYANRCLVILEGINQYRKLLFLKLFNHVYQLRK